MNRLYILRSNNTTPEYDLVVPRQSKRYRKGYRKQLYKRYHSIKDTTKDTENRKPIRYNRCHERHQVEKSQ